MDDLTSALQGRDAALSALRRLEALCVDQGIDRDLVYEVSQFRPVQSTVVEYSVVYCTVVYSAVFFLFHIFCFVFVFFSFILNFVIMFIIFLCVGFSS